MATVTNVTDRDTTVTCHALHHRNIYRDSLSLRESHVVRDVMGDTVEGMV